MSDGTREERLQEIDDTFSALKSGTQFLLKLIDIAKADDKAGRLVVEGRSITVSSHGDFAAAIKAMNAGSKAETMFVLGYAVTFDENLPANTFRVVA